MKGFSESKAKQDRQTDRQIHTHRHIQKGSFKLKPFFLSHTHSLTTRPLATGPQGCVSGQRWENTDRLFLPMKNSPSIFIVPTLRHVALLLLTPPPPSRPSPPSTPPPHHHRIRLSLLFVPRRRGPEEIIVKEIADARFQ